MARIKTVIWPLLLRCLLLSANFPQLVLLDLVGLLGGREIFFTSPSPENEVTWRPIISRRMVGQSRGIEFPWNLDPFLLHHALSEELTSEKGNAISFPISPSTFLSPTLAHLWMKVGIFHWASEKIPFSLHFLSEAAVATFHPRRGEIRRYEDMRSASTNGTAKKRGARAKRERGRREGSSESRGRTNKWKLLTHTHLLRSRVSL